MTESSPKQRYRYHLDQGDIQPDVAQAFAIDHLEHIYQALKNAPVRQGLLHRFFGPKPEPVPGLYLWGGVGTGKTLLMDIFAGAVGAEESKRIHFHRFMQSIHDQKATIKDQQNPLKIIAAGLADQCRVLCLDEFSVTDITDAMILSELLRHLFDQGITLVTTSNTQIENLYANGLQRDRFKPAIKLLLDHTQQLEVDTGRDYRRQYLLSKSVYHCPLGSTAHESMNIAFHELAGPYESKTRRIDLSGREVPVIAYGPDVIWFDFETLCEGNRSKMDYIELSRQFHTVLLSDIPVLYRTQDDSARRFIELVDELYDRGVNLIISAAALPDKLYQGVRLAEPFKRTISRLQEMSSPEYLEKTIATARNQNQEK